MKASNKINIAVLEDNKSLLEDLVYELKQTDLVEVTVSSLTSSDFIQMVSTSKYEISAVVLDIELLQDSMSGIDVARKLKLPTLFISGKTRDYLSEIEELNMELVVPVDHLLKPASQDKLKRILPKFITEIERYYRNKLNDYIVVKTANSHIKIDQNTIVFIETLPDKSNNKKIYFTDREPITLFDFSFSKMFENRFDPDLFIEPHQSYRVNKNQIKSYNLSENKLIPYQFINDSKQPSKGIPVSENNRTKMRKFFSVNKGE